MKSHSAMQTAKPGIVLALLASSLALTCQAELGANDLEPFGTVTTNEYVHERIDTLDGYLEVWSRTYMDADLRMFETTVSNFLGVLHPMFGAYFYGFGISTVSTERVTWEHWYYPAFMYVQSDAMISNGYGERFTYAAEMNQQEVWKIFTNDIRSLVVVDLPQALLATNILITTLGPTMEPEPGMLCIGLAAGALILRKAYAKRGSANL